MGPVTVQVGGEGDRPDGAADDVIVGEGGSDEEEDGDEKSSLDRVHAGDGHCHPSVRRFLLHSQKMEEMGGGKQNGFFFVPKNVTAFLRFF